MTLEEHLVELEIRLTHQAQQIATLDEVIREFAARVQRLEDQLAAAPPPTTATRAPGDDEPPPHY